MSTELLHRAGDLCTLCKKQLHMGTTQNPQMLLRSSTPWVRYRVIAEFAGFPRDIAGIIIDYLKVMELRDWIPENFVAMQSQFAANPNALLSGMIDLTDKSVFLAANYVASEHINKNLDKYSKYLKWANKPVAELLFSIGAHPSTQNEFYNLGFCESELTIKWILDNVPKQDAIGYLSGNSMAIDILRQNIGLIDHCKIWG